MEQDMKRKYSITEEDYRVLETTIIKMEPHKAGPQWKFIGAFYFATVVLVMIGPEKFVLSGHQSCIPTFRKDWKNI